MTVLALRVYYADTDAGGIVYHASYIVFCERGRTEFLRELGFDHGDLLASHGMAFVVRHIDAHYLAPSRLDDWLEVRTSIHELGRTRIVMAQSVARGDKVLFEMKVTLVCVGLDGRPVRPPESLMAAFEGSREHG